LPAHLISGGARSGKSAYAEKLALESLLPVTYIATARSGDSEMGERIGRHRARRPAGWRTVECERELGETLLHLGQPDSCVIVDCITLWLANLLGDGGGESASSTTELTELRSQRAVLLQAIGAIPAQVLIVTNELGSGVVPLGRMTRLFVDEHGATNQLLAQASQRVTLMVCGLPLAIKPPAPAAPAAN
jgi:adenosylcobinamide kinase / adenosylcobinamide-phosphate guanylyltransferase